MKKQILTIGAMLLCTLAFGQGELTGVVQDAGDFTPLIGASVQVVVANYGTITDAKGNFRLYGNSPEVRLRISYLGYFTKDTLVKPNKGELVIRLLANDRALAQVVVSTGYQQLNKERLTGSFSQLNTVQLERVVSPNLLSRLDGNVSGLVFNRTNQENDISIRGRSTIYAGAQPLIVIDDFPYEGDLSNINPNDVESVTVLKDAAAASVWGTRAGNGVIVITTKKGKLNQPLKVSFNANATLQQKPDQFYAPRMTTADFIAVEQQLFAKGFYSTAENSASHAPLTPVVELLIANRDGKLSGTQLSNQLKDLGNLDVRNDIDRYLYQDGLQQQYYLQLSGGSIQQKYHFSLGADEGKANLVRNGQSRISLNAGNSFYLLNNKLELQQSLSLIHSQVNRNNPGNSLLSFGTGSNFIYPYMQLADAQGKPLAVNYQYRNSFLATAPTQGLLDWYYRPLDELALANNGSENNDYRVGMNIKYHLSKSLDAQIFYQYNLSQTNSQNLQTPDSWYTRNQINSYSSVANGMVTRPIPFGSILDAGTGALSAHYLRGQLNYSARFGKLHELQAFAGYELRKQKNTLQNSRQYGYREDQAGYSIVDYLKDFPLSYQPFLTSRILYADGRTELTDRFLSYYGNAAYTFNDKYTFTASTRLDQSNLFGVDANQKGVPLGSAGLRWNVAKEGFYHFAPLPTLALRLSFGYNGNIDKSLSAYITARTISNSLLTALPYARVINPPNPSLQWERTKIWNLGLDFGSKNQVITGSLDFYFKKGLDLIGDGPLPPSVGTDVFRGNTANTKGKGLDLALHSLNLEKGLRWETDFLLSYAKDEVSSYSNLSTVNNYLLYGSGTGNQNLVFPLVGKPLFAIYSYRWAGLNPQTGAPRGYDANGQPTEDYAAIINNTSTDQLHYYGSARPLYFGSFRNTFSYHQFSLTANVVYRLGYFIRKPSVVYNNVLSGEISHGDYELRWQKPGDESITQIPAMPTTLNNFRDQFYGYSDALVEKGDHIRLQDMNFSYRLKTKSAKSFLNGATAYLYLANLGVLWKAGNSVYDPDYFYQQPTFQSSLGFKLNF